MYIRVTCSQNLVPVLLLFTECLHMYMHMHTGTHDCTSSDQIRLVKLSIAHSIQDTLIVWHTMQFGSEDSRYMESGTLSNAPVNTEQGGGI